MFLAARKKAACSVDELPFRLWCVTFRGGYLTMRIRKPKSAPVGVIGKVLRILELLDRFPGGLELKDVAGKTGINKSTAHRFLSHLEAENYLLRDATGAYILSPRTARLGGSVSFEATLCKISLPILENLLKTTTETVNLGVLEGFHVLYLNVLESPHRFRLVSQIGTHGPISSTALGKAILASMEEGPRKDELFASITFKANTPHTLVTMGRLKADLARTRTRGYSEDDEEAFVGARCIGAAIRGADGTVAAAISVSGPTSRISRERLSFYSSQVCQAAQEISCALGYRPSKTQRPTRKSLR